MSKWVVVSDGVYGQIKERKVGVGVGVVNRGPQDSDPTYDVRGIGTVTE